MAAVDPFEAAAKREEREELRREMRKRWVWKRVRGNGMGTVLIIFGLPYVLWGLLRAASFHFGDPTIPQSLVHFFFGKWWLFGVYTGWMLFLVWVWLIDLANSFRN